MTSFWCHSFSEYTSGFRDYLVCRPHCVLYAQGMTFGGDLGLVVASSRGKARAVLVCTTPLETLCPSCVIPEHNTSEGRNHARQIPAIAEKIDFTVD